MAVPFEGATSRSNKAITPSDTVPLPAVADAIYVGTGGDVVVLAKGDSTVQTFKNVPSGTVLPTTAQRVNSTNTTATDLIAMYY